MKRQTKQAVIGFFYLSFLGAFFILGYFLFFYTTPTCTDGKKNQDETKVDCGGSCGICIDDLVSSPLQFTEVTLLPYTEESSDALAVVTNPNGKAALKSATYTFSVKNAEGIVVASNQGEISLLPKETKTFLALGLPVSKEGNSVEFSVTNEEWIAFTAYESAPDIMIANQKFTLLSGGIGYAEAFGLVRNMSPYDIRAITVNVVLRDANGKALSVNKTTLNTLVSGEERDFRLVWPRQFEGEAVRAEMSYDLNSFRSDAFVKQYFPGGQYQTLNPGN